ncbi:MAG: glycosyltransferase family 4 protein [Aggregatilineales bacterium]
MTLHIGLLAADLTQRHGWAHYSLSVARALQRAGAQVTIVTTTNSPQPTGLDALPLLPTVDPLEGGLLLKQFARLPRARRALADCDIIHAAIEPFAPLAAALAGRRPLFVTGHGSYVRIAQQRRFPASAIYQWALRRARLVCVSRYTASEAQRLLPGVETIVINNGIDAERFATLPPLTEPKRGPTVLSVGAVKARKGTLELVRALAVVRRQLPTVQGVFIGDLEADPEYVTQVRQEIDALGLTDCVHLLGRRADEALLAWYGAADAFVLPARSNDWKFEGFGLALLEASAAGLPVIGATGSGVEDAIDDGVTGLLVPHDQLETALPEAILRVLGDPALARAFGAAGRAKAHAQTWDAVAVQLIARYEAALNLGQASPC